MNRICKLVRGGTLQRIAAALLIACSATITLAAEQYMDGRKVVLSDAELPADAGNPFNMLAFMHNSEPALDSRGEPHHHGHLIQVIVDGGNRMQDPPDPDGSPGGDDSLAYGNFNLMVLQGVETPFVEDGDTGLFFGLRYFVPYQREGVYYLRLWEGNDVKSAPYYQDSSEYIATNGDQGGGMIMMSPRTIQGPMETNWRFGKSVPRPKK
jgi:hypothetical protein